MWLISYPPIRSCVETKNYFLTVNDGWSGWVRYSGCTKACGTETQIKYRYGNNLTPFGVEINELEIHRKQDIVRLTDAMMCIWDFKFRLKGTIKLITIRKSLVIGFL